MTVPISQMWAVTSHILRQKLRGRERYPLVLMLEPLYRCNLACAGCGKIQYPSHVLKRHLSVDECMSAADEVDAPIVSIPGGEPLLHPDIEAIVAGLVQRRRYVYLCTNAILLAEHLDRLQPSRYLNLSVHLDGDRAAHDDAVCRDGVYDKAEDAIRMAVSRGFRVTTNTTLFRGIDPERTRRFFDTTMDLGVESMTLSPGYPYAEAPDQEGFLDRSETQALFRRLLEGPRKSWRFNHSPLYLEFLTGRQHLECSPWSNPSYGVFGWQRPCYLLQEGYTSTFGELMESTDWDDYGHASGNPSCAECMVHSGHEGSAVTKTFSGWRGIATTVRAMMSSSAAPATDFVLSMPEPREFRARLAGATPSGIEAELREALEARHDHRLTTHEGREQLGYLFDIGPDDVCFLAPGTREVVRVPIHEIKSIETVERAMPAS